MQERRLCLSARSDKGPSHIGLFTSRSFPWLRVLVNISVDYISLAIGPGSEGFASCSSSPAGGKEPSLIEIIGDIRNIKHVHQAAKGPLMCLKPCDLEGGGCFDRKWYMLLFLCLQLS